MRKIVGLVFALTIVTFTLQAQGAHKLLRKGDKSYSEKDFVAAEGKYRKALQKEKDAQANYNLGNAVYQQERFNEAIKQYEEAVSSAKGNAQKSMAYHNLGNAHYKAEQFDKSVESYKNALRLNPQDQQTKFNLAMAQRQLQMQQQSQQQSQQDQDEQQDNQQDEQQDNQQQQPNEGGNDEQQDQSQDQQEQNQEEKQNEPTESEDRPLSKEEARKLLEIMEREEQKVQEKLKKTSAKKTKPKKDW